MPYLPVFKPFATH